MNIPYALIAALILVESGGNNAAIGDNGKAHGCLQIRQAVLTDYRFLTGERITLAQCHDPLVSVAVCSAYLNHWTNPKFLGHEPTLEDAARIWNGGPTGWKKTSTHPYWLKVKAVLDAAH